MSGRAAAIAILVAALLAGGGIYYLEQFHWYDVSREGEGEIVLTTPRGEQVPLVVDELRLAEGAASPLKYRACFSIRQAPQELADGFAPYPEAEPTVAPATFPCFDAGAIASALAAGDAVPLLGRRDVVYGIDRVVAVGRDGTGHAWHQINRCGQAAFDGDPVPEGCPPPPDPGGE